MTIKKLNDTVVDCTQCARLVAYRQEVAGAKKRQFQHDTYWGKPVPGFGDQRARVLIVGLAPAPHGSNRTGRMFTGDGIDGMGSSDFLMRALHQVGYANQPISRHRQDGLTLSDAYMTAIVRCAPPGNKPNRDEIKTCAAFLDRELALMKNVEVIVALGKLAFDQMLNLFAERGADLPKPRLKFAHSVVVDVGPDRPVLLGSYHPSRQNTQTGKLTPEMLESIFQTAKQLISHRV